jgi:hypothetical protein
MTRSPPVSRHSANAFTLVEVLTASAIALLLLSALAGAVIRMGEDGRRLGDHIDRGARVRLVLDQMSTDLQSILVRQDTNNWLALDILEEPGNSGLWLDAPGQKPASDSLVLDPRTEPDEKGREWALPEDYRFGVGGMWLRFFTTAADRGILDDGKPVPGDVNAVSYQLIRRAMPGVGEGTSAGGSYQLFRSLVKADETFRSGYKIEAYAGAASTGGPGELKSPSEDSLICDNILDIGVIVHEMNAEQQFVQAFPMRHKSLPPLKNPRQYRVPQDGIPASIEIMIRVISLSGSRELRSAEAAGLDPEAWWRLAKRHSRMYSRHFSIPRAF